MTYLLTIDGGKSTGIVLGNYSATEPYRRVAYWQPRGGVVGFNQWYRDNRYNHDNEGSGEFEYYGGLKFGDGIVGADLEVVAEKFTPHDNPGFSHTLDSVEPLRIEGALITLGLMPDYPASAWQQPSEMYFMADSKDPLRVKKKKAQEWLKRYGLWMTGAPVGHTDGADVNSATLHAIVAMRKSNHAPTLRAYFGPRPLAAVN